MTIDQRGVPMSNVLVMADPSSGMDVACLESGSGSLSRATRPGDVPPVGMLPIAAVEDENNLSSSTGSALAKYVIVGAQTPNLVQPLQSASNVTLPSPGVPAITSGESAAGASLDAVRAAETRAVSAETTAQGLRKEILEKSEQISRAEHLLQQVRMETATRIELSQNQVKHVIDQVKLSERHIEEQQRTFGEAQVEHHQS